METLGNKEREIERKNGWIVCSPWQHVDSDKFSECSYLVSVTRSQFEVRQADLEANLHLIIDDFVR